MRRLEKAERLPKRKCPAAIALANGAERLKKQMRLTISQAGFQGRSHSGSTVASEPFIRIAQTAALFRKIRLAAVADAPLESIAEISDEGLMVARSMAADLDRRPDHE